MAQGEFLVALVSCDWTCSLHAGTVAIFVNRAAVLICLRVFESDGFTADGTDRRKLSGLHLGHLRISPLNSKTFGVLHLSDPEPRTLFASTFEHRVRGKYHVPAPITRVPASALWDRHHLEIALLDAIRAPDNA